MLGIIKYVIIVIFAIISVLILLLFIAADIYAGIQYKKAPMASAIIESVHGTRQVPQYGRNKTLTYTDYVVSFYVNGEVQTGIYSSANKMLSIGKYVILKYKIHEDGLIEVLDNTQGERVQILLLSIFVVGTVAIGVFLVGNPITRVYVDKVLDWYKQFRYNLLKSFMIN